MAVLDSRSGKDTFVHFCQQHRRFHSLNISTVDFVKEVATICGWDGTKTLQNRKFLSDLKDLLTEWNNVPFKKVVEQIENYKATLRSYDFDPDKEGLVFIHCREPEEIQKFVDALGAQTLLIRRPDVENNATSNHADANVFDFDYDYTITNDGSLDDLSVQAKLFIANLFCD